MEYKQLVLVRCSDLPALDSKHRTTKGHSSLPVGSKLIEVNNGEDGRFLPVLLKTPVKRCEQGC
eukprot:1650175-Amphidinium_carterae.1